MSLHRLAITLFLAITLHAADEDGLTPLHRAVEADDVTAAAKLLQSRAAVNTPTRNGVTPLWLAVMNRNAEMVELLLKAGADPNGALPSGETILMTAARTGNSEVADALIKRGAKVSATGPAFGETALMLAAGENHAGVIRVLLQHGAEINGRSSKLDYAKDRFGLEGVLTILPHGSWTPLMYAAREGSLDAARALTEAGAELNAADNEGTTPLLLAITNSHYDTAALLIEKGADVNLGDTTAMAPLFAAVDMNTLGEVFGRPTRVSRDKFTALDLMKVLLDRGANPNAGLKSTTLQRAHTPGEPTLNEGATPLARAARAGDTAAMEILIARGANVSQPLKNGTTPLMFATGLGRGVSAFAKDSGTEGELIAAAKLLLDHGADINAVSTAGQTAMHFAAQATDANFPAPSDDMVKLLVARGAKLDVVDKQGRSPIEMAEGKGLRGRAGGPVKARESTIALLKSLR
jgi:ankyrin repeat protein